MEARSQLQEGMTVDEKALTFALDGPKPRWFEAIGSPIVVTGWIAASQPNSSVVIKVEVNGRLRAAGSTGLRRDDVRNALPDLPGALWSGFATEVWVDDLEGKRVDVAVKAERDEAEILVHQFSTRIKGLVGV